MASSTRSTPVASLFIAALCSLGVALRAQEAHSANSYSLVHVNVVDVRNGEVHANQSVVIDGGRIRSITPAGRVSQASVSRSIDCTGLYLIPGLWDMHVHLAFGDWFPQAKEISLPLFVVNGVTSVRDMGSDLARVLAWRKEIETGTLFGPRIFTSGPMLDGPKPRFPSSVPIATPEDGRRAVDELKRQGVDFIKLQSLIPREAVFAIAEQARKDHIAFEGHVPDSVRATEMSKAGMKSFEHLIGIFEASSPSEDNFLKGGKTETAFLSSFDSGRAGKLANLLAAKGTWQCPTLVWERGGNFIDVTDFASDTRARYVPSSWKEKTWQRFTDEIEQGYGVDNLSVRTKFVNKELQVVKLLLHQGVPFLAGTDTPAGVYIFPGFSLHEELQRFVAAGFTPLQALQTATLNPARFFEKPDMGTVETGKIADLVLLTANPLSDISNTQKIAAVIRRGEYLSREHLEALLREVERNAHVAK